MPINSHYLAMLQMQQQQMIDPVELAKQEAKKNLAFVRQSQIQDEIQQKLDERHAELQEELNSIDEPPGRPGRQKGSKAAQPQMGDPATRQLLMQRLAMMGGQGSGPGNAGYGPGGGLA